MADLFRLIFAEELGARGRRRPQPGSFNIVTLGEPTFEMPPLEGADLGRFNLVGAGAIGQAAALALAKSGVVGTMFAVDPEKLAVSNLQRHVLTRDDDVGAVKVDLLRERLSDTGVEVVPIPMRWDHMLVDGQAPTLVALDTPEDRIGVQASLPGPVCNAWTQPSDVGWSRHERFGEQPCLACFLLAGPRASGPARADRRVVRAASASGPRVPRTPNDPRGAAAAEWRGPLDSRARPTPRIERLDRASTAR
jgi:hypothetical protein